MPRIKPLLVLCAALLTVTPAASADVNSDMNQFFNKLGFASNTTQPGVWQGQAAGYAYGGSLYARTQVKNVQLISMTLPDINAGCGGIDAYLGSFSFINGEQLQRFVKQIMSNAAGYFFDLALQTTVPEIKTAKDFVQKMASDINSMNLSSCQAAQGIIGGLFPRTQVSQQKVCQDIAGESNIFADWAASRQGCTVGGKSDSVRDKASDKDKERVTKNINIMWNALSKNRMFDGNKELKEFVMTLTGSPSHKIAEFAAGEIGEKEHLKASEQYSYGADPVRDGVSTGKDMERQTLVSYSDIQSLPDLTCYVTLPGPYPAVKLSLKYQTRPKVAPEFIPRDINPEMENRLSAVLAAREAEGRQMASLFEPDVPEVVSGEDVTQAEQPQQPVSPAINDKKSDAGVNVPAGGIEQELKMKPEEEMEQQLPPGISESGEVVDMAVYEAWQREQNPDIQQKMQRREEVNINVHRERGEDVEPGDDF